MKNEPYHPFKLKLTAKEGCKTVFSVIGIMITAFAIWIGSQVPALLYVALEQPMQIILNGLTQIILVFIVVFLICRFIFHLSLRDIRIAIFKISPMSIFIAILLPLLFSMFYIVAVPGNFQTVEHTSYEKFLIVFIGLFGSCLTAAITEEMIFRGLCMRFIEKKLGIVAGILIPSFFFGAAHIAMGNNMGLIDTLLLLIAGTCVGSMFSLIAYQNNSIWAGILVHGLWNLRSTFLYLGDKVSEDSLVTYQFASNSKLLTGGNFGVESSLIAIAMYCIVILIFVHSIKRASEKSMAAII